jgi:hypothetical protein
MSCKITYYFSLACLAQGFVFFADKKKSIVQKIILLLCVAIHSETVSCQESKLSEVIVNIAEDLAASESDQEAAAAYTDRLYELADNPVNLNSGSEEEIARLFFLSDFQVRALTDYSLNTGKIVSFNELAFIPGFNSATAEMIIPFSTLTGEEILITDSVKFRSLLITNLSVKKTGTRDTISMGSAFKVLTKYKFSAGNFKGGFTIEKDQGERLFCPGTMSPDFFSVNITYSGTGLVRKVILGDFSARFGQGTNINTGISRGLSLTSMGYMSATNEIKAYTSTDENNFFRGIATVFSFKKLDFSLVYSKNNTDATLGTSSGLSKDCLESFYRSGIHNTATLLLKKDALSESVIGINLSYNFRSAKFGIAWSENRFSLPVKPDYSNPEKIFNFGGEYNTICTFYYNSMIKKILLYGEVSANDIRKFAVEQGLSFRPSDRLTINFLFWKYAAGFTSFHGNGPGGSSGNYSEQSLLGNFSFEAARHLFITGGCYIQHFPWLKYRCSSPSYGLKRETGIKYMPTERLVFDWLYSYRLSMVNNTGTRSVPERKQTIAKSLKFVVRYSIYENLTLATRTDYRIVDPSVSKGFLLLEDFNFRLKKIPLSLWMRYCVFMTDDYESRIYTWEHDLLYTLSIPALYGNGNRFYLMAGWKIAGKAELRFKYGILSDSESPGNSEDTEEFRLQLKLFI